MKIAAIILFITLYVIMILKPQYRTRAAVVIAVVFVILRIMPVSGIPAAINWNVLLMIAGTMVIVDFFIDSKMPNRIADLLLDKAKNVCWVTIYMSLFAGAISAFIDNVATVLMVAPVGLAVCKKLDINPVPMILSIAVSSNLQGAATLVGDTTSIMLGAYAGMDFMDFFWMNGKPGIFFAVELGAIATIPVMMFLFRKDTAPVSSQEKTVVTNYFPSIILVAMVVSLIVASFIPGKPDITNGIICCILGAVCMIYDWRKFDRTDGIVRSLRSIDLDTLILLTSLFVIIGGLTEVGIIDDIAGWIANVGSSGLFVLYTLIVWISVAVSAFVDNIPYVATMLPVVRSVSSLLGVEPYLLYFGLLSGATLGGNLTPVGASANIAATGILKKAGYTVKTKDFVRIGVPFTLVAVTVGYLFIWAVWH